MRQRPLTQKNEYYIPKEDYLTVLHYSRRYPLWLAEIQDAADTATAIRYDKAPVQTSGTSDPTHEAAVRIEGISAKVRTIDDLIESIGQDLGKWLKLGVCYGLTYDQLKGRGMPCERQLYYSMRRRYYFELAKKI